MKTIIGDNVFITKFNYSKHMSRSEYRVFALRQELEYAEKALENEKKPKNERVALTRPTYPWYGQRVSNCFILHGKVGEKEMGGRVVDVSTVNHPIDQFTFAEGRMVVFKTALDAMLDNEDICKEFGISDKREVRKQFMHDFRNQCPTSFMRA